jgi:YspA, cpYpsA-related SLOG family
MTFVGVCGGRDYRDQVQLNDVLRVQVRGDDIVVHGDASGADSMADDWARRNGNHVIRIPALWESYGRSAGPRRNAVIATLNLRLLIAFPGDVGTADMVRKANAKGIEVVEVPPRR